MFSEALQIAFLLYILIISVLITFYNSALNMCLYYGLLGIWFYYFTFVNKAKIKKGLVGILMYGFLTLGSTIINGIFSGNEEIVQMIWRNVRILLTLWIGFCFADNTEAKVRKNFYILIYILILISIAYGFYQKSAGIGWGYNSRMDSFFGHPIVYGSILIIEFWLTSYLVDSVVLRCGLYIYILLGLLSTGSRSSWIALAVTFVFSIIKSNGLTRRKMWFVLVGTICAVFFTFTEQFEIIYETVFGRFSGMMQQGSAVQRLGSYLYIFIRLLNQNPLQIIFGCGEGAASDAMIQTVISIQSFATTDSQYLTVLYNYGFTGLAMLLYFGVSVIKRYFSESDTPEIAMLSVSLIGLMITAVFYDLYGWLSISTLCMLFAGMYICIRHKQAWKPLTVDTDT